MRLLVLSIHSSTRQMRQSTNSLASLNSLLWNRITQGVVSKADFFSSLENLTIHVSGSEGCSWSALRAHKDCSSRIKTILFVLPFISSEVHNTLSSPPCSSFSKIVLDLWGLSILRMKETGTVICFFLLDIFPGWDKLGECGRGASHEALSLPLPDPSLWPWANCLLPSSVLCPPSSHSLWHPWMPLPTASFHNLPKSWLG